MLANDGLSDKPKEDRVVKFKDEVPSQPQERERGRSAFRKGRSAKKQPQADPNTKSILKDTSRTRLAKTKNNIDQGNI